MHRRPLFQSLFAFAVTVLSLLSTGAAESKPNFLLIMCDDMGWSDIGCYGGEVRTPHLDRMAAQGTRFTQFYNNAKCTTTRASLVTGLYPRRSGGLLQRNMVTLGEALKPAGYQTALSGKWHLGRGDTTHPYKRGFDQYYGLLDGCCNFFNPNQPDPKYKGSRVRYFAHNDQRITEFPKDYYTTDAFTDHAIKTIRSYHGQSKPWMLHLCYTAPHYPLHAKPEDIAKYRGKFKMGWEQMRRDRYARQLKMGLIDKKRYPLSDTDPKSYDWDKATHDFEDHRMAVYAAMIDSMDQNIGRLLALLDELKVADNTVVMFLSDNGGCSEEPGGRDPKQRTPGPGNDYVAVGPAWGWAQNAPFRRYKSWVHEGGINTPFIVRWPGKVRANAINTEDVGHIIDILPTFLDLAGARYPDKHDGNSVLPVEGVSLKPVLLGKKVERHRELCWEWSGNRAIRRGDIKAVSRRGSQWELFDLSNDRTETNNLASEQPELTKELADAWHAWANMTGLKTERNSKPRDSKIKTKKKKG